MKTFKNKVVWITGASSGFGEAMAYAFAEQGARIILSARRESELKRVQNKIENAAVITLDLTQSNSFKSKTEEAIEVYGKIDIIIHNGGIAQNASAIETTSEVQRQIMEVDFFSYTELTQCLLPHFIKRKSGHIVVVSGLLGKVAMPNRTSYCAAKAALHGYFNSLRAELINDNIDITLLVPSFLDTSLTTKALGANGEPTGKKAETTGCSVEKASGQVIKAVNSKKYEAFIGNNDKGRFLLWMSRIFPNMATNIILKQSRKQEA